MLDVRKELNEDTCYIKPMIVSGRRLYVIHSHEGFPTTGFDEWDVAFQAARMHGIIPMPLH